ncbi:MAG: threonylcarbamoyl-AMP synthase [Candidatus Sungbacteria bacterium RIFCSPLOWO2_02_FULL_54_10]|uniref:L-threonylcarbamoyladenylate synthase n=2 Tax=Candidatus Sungiibacteriota TaxID=1817917 RepID=A0A1G2L8Y0_9BACT|nr:MAG: threonylcarbamoyl-AMP synthase [Candidatus Sungbacteria bacterium RIFCSPHIGHO2_02_FULL_53_17]OHA08093.1 MAG: threonylcarbamoyl-AMP synthase [Candidatus Sungbacteria bacterium RIFCSPLOWO2_01_FULL_54_21]OHA12854.1 MAG: threonylcarbamoyl-AMP synthase [Candidatus Sungbacteria bacterium RIFCSPLOWO2_02_FULL_54_10]
MMQILSITDGHTAPVVERVLAAIRAGGTAAVPTDTVYGLVCDARNEDAIKRLFAMKKRPEEKALPIFVKDIADARRYAYISDAKAKFLERVWPGAVTVVLHHKGKLPAILTGGKDTLGLRIPDHPFLGILLERADFPLAQTSANISHMPAAKSCEEVEQYFGEKKERPEIFVDGGVLPGASSKVIDCTGAHPLLLRAGPISPQDLDALTREGE